MRSNLKKRQITYVAADARNMNLEVTFETVAADILATLALEEVLEDAVGVEHNLLLRSSIIKEFLSYLSGVFHVINNY